MIEKLTEQQEAELIQYRDEWFKIGTSTEPADRPRAERSISLIYQALNYQVPPFIWVDSPAAAAIVISFFKHFESSIKGSTPSDWQRILSVGVANDTDDSGDMDLIKKYGPILNNSGSVDIERDIKHYRAAKLSLMQVTEKEYKNCCDEKILRQTKEKLNEALRDNLPGQENAYWVAFYRFCRHIGVVYDAESNKSLDLWSEITSSCGWWFPYEKVCIVCERPAVLSWDNRTPPVLHSEYSTSQRSDVITKTSISENTGNLLSKTVDLENETPDKQAPVGPAVKYRDGYSVYCWHGVKVTEKCIMFPEQLTVAEIKSETNAEVRRIMRERMGESRYLSECGAKLIDADSRSVSVLDITEGRGVPRALLEDDEGRRFLVGTDHSTKRVYYMEVPRTTTTCKQAHESLSGIDESMIISQS